MHPAHEAALENVRVSFGMFEDVLNDIPDEALGWKPVPAGNTIQVLVTHSISATKFWVEVGCGVERSLKAYREGERGEAFVDKRATAGTLKADIAAFLDELQETLQVADEAALAATHEWPDVQDSPRVNGYGAILRALTHLREHVGEAQLTRDLWRARNS